MDDLNLSENHVDKLRDKVNVAVRVRPFLTREQGETEKWIVNKNELRQKEMDEKSGVISAFAFDHVFNQSVKTSELYNTIVAPIVRDSFKGFNGTILCYGQTSSGKTHTMYGGDLDKGIITLFAEHLFRHIKADSECKEYFIKVGVIEIYNEKLTDLLEPENTIEVRIGKGGSVVPFGLKEVEVNNSSELIDIVRLSHAQRKTRETQMNDQSSRSHTVLRVLIEVANLSNASPEEGEPSDALSSALTTSVLHFVDLAGSEKQSQTGSEGDGLKEAGHINKSLSTLSMVINQLSKDTQPPEQSEQTVLRTAACTGPRKGVYPPRIPQPTNQTTHVSFRNSKLTRLLESTLRGEAYITMICNVTIANLVETKSTLNFAKTAKNIKVQPKQNFGTSNELKKRILELQQTVEEKDKEVTRLQKKLDSYQKILPGHHAVQKLKCQLNRSFEVSSPDKRRHTLCMSTTSNMSSVSTFKMPFAKFPSDDGKFMSTEETALHFQSLTSERESRYGEGLCDKEVQTDAQRFTTPKRTNSTATSCDTPVQTLRLTTSILRDAYESDALEWTDRMSFLEEENKMLRSLEAENKTMLEEATQKIKTLNAEKIELENDVLRQMQASKKEMHRRVADSAEYGELQRKLDAMTKSAEEDKVILQDKLYECTSKFDNIIQQMKSEISKVSKEREEFEDRCLMLESSELKLKESFNQLLTVEKGILEKELQERQAEVIRLEEELKVSKEAQRFNQLLTVEKGNLEKELQERQAEVIRLEEELKVSKEAFNQLLTVEKGNLEKELQERQAEVIRLEEELKVSKEAQNFNQLLTVEKGILEKELQERQVEVNRLEEELKVSKEAQNFNQLLTVEKGNLEKELQERQVEVNRLEEELKVSKEAFNQLLTVEKGNLEKELQERQAEVIRLEEELKVSKEAQRFNQLLTVEKGNLEKELQERQAEVIRLEEELKVSKEAFNELLTVEKGSLEKELQERQVEVIRLEEELKVSKEAQNFNQLLTVEKGILEKELQERQVEVNRLEEELKVSKEAFNQLLTVEKGNLEKELQERQAEVIRLEEELKVSKEAQRFNQLLTVEKGNLEKELQERQAEVIRLEEELKVSKEAFNELLTVEKGSLEKELQERQVEVIRLEEELKVSKEAQNFNQLLTVEKGNLEKELQERQAEVIRLEEELKVSKEAFNELLTVEKGSLEKELQERQVEVIRLEEELKVSKEAQNFNQLLTVEKGNLEKELQERQAEVIRLEEELKVSKEAQRFNQLLTVEKGNLEKELQERQVEVIRLEEELKVLKEAPLPPTPGTTGKQQKIKVNRNVQCDLWKDDEAYCSELRKAAISYRTRAKKAEADLEKLGDTVQLINEKDSRISELESSVERLEKDVRDLNKIILDSVPVDDGKEFGFERGIQCDLLQDQIEDAKTSEEKRSLLPASIADILTLRSEVQAAKDKNHHLYSLLRRYESQQEQAVAAGGLLSSSAQSRSNFTIGKPRPPSGLVGPLRMNFGPRITPAPSFQLPSSKPKLRTPSQFINQPIVVAAPETQPRDPEEVENVPVHPSATQKSNMESSSQKKKNGDDNVMPSHMNPKRIKISSAPTATIQSKSMTVEATSSSVLHSSNHPSSSVVTSVSSSGGVQPPVPIINLGDDDDSGSEDFMEFLNKQNEVFNAEKQKQSLPKAPTPLPQQPALGRLILEESDEEGEEETWLEFYNKLNKEGEEKNKKINN